MKIRIIPTLIVAVVLALRIARHVREFRQRVRQGFAIVRVLREVQGFKVFEAVKA